MKAEISYVSNVAALEKGESMGFHVEPEYKYAACLINDRDLENIVVAYVVEEEAQIRIEFRNENVVYIKYSKTIWQKLNKAMNGA